MVLFNVKYSHNKIMKILFFIIVSIFLISCGGGGGSTPPEQIFNQSNSQANNQSDTLNFKDVPESISIFEPQ